ncbi:hypothetical protein [Salicibibacter kimchii]|uniref:Uncharacterized protein n=1 Tax=Salicibibacter kimchii TaxID=2099786 RepID=A0A345BZQ0_9BACI|nr:hypothetical protein [Salicibibacter kimchii]AXF56431.1 hypothetical protein DT065_10625 [Salicibibacter kimchii]
MALQFGVIYAIIVVQKSFRRMQKCATPCSAKAFRYWNIPYINIRLKHNAWFRQNQAFLFSTIDLKE